MTVIHGDCLEVMRTLPDGTFRTIVTSPPYNMISDATKPSLDVTRKAGRGYDGHSDDMPRTEYVRWQRSCLAEMFRLLRDDGAIFYNQKPRVQFGLLEDPREIVSGVPVRQMIIWDKDGSINIQDTFFLPSYEVIYLIPKPDFRIRRECITYGDVWHVRPDRNNPHPAPFPTEIPLRCVRAAGGPVLDPFAGSGTTGVAAIQLGEPYTLIESSEKYVEMTNRRLAGVVPQQRLA